MCVYTFKLFEFKLGHTYQFLNTFCRYILNECEHILCTYLNGL